MFSNTRGSIDVRKSRTDRGFTLVELIVVITALGVLSFAAFTRLSNRADSDAHGYAAELGATVRHAQSVAIAQRRNVYVNVSGAAARVWACLDPATPCTQPLAYPAGDPIDASAPAGVAVSGSAAQFSFDALGRPSLSNRITIGVTAATASFGVTIEPETGYVRRF